MASVSSNLSVIFLAFFSDQASFPQKLTSSWQVAVVILRFQVKKGDRRLVQGRGVQVAG
jgi:hypothetical protein